MSERSESRSTNFVVDVELDSDNQDPLIGRVINDRFRVIELLDRGGMAKVYRAEQSSLGRQVALKVLDTSYSGFQSADFKRRFVLEAAASAKLTHPNTVTIFDYGATDDGIYFLAMELLYGRTLAHALESEAPFSLERTMHIAWQICRSLREAHGIGIVHRDLKPGNIFLVQHDDDPDFVKVLDFGLVKHFDQAPLEDMTEAGMLFGSPRYMSPEQVRGDPTDPRSDIYALGVNLFEMLSGRPLFDYKSNIDMLVAHLQKPPPRIYEANADVTVPLEMEEIVLKCLAKNPDDRYANMDELLAAFRRIFGGDPLGNLSGDTKSSRKPAGGPPPIKRPGSPSGEVPQVASGAVRTGTRSGSQRLPARSASAASGRVDAPPRTGSGRLDAPPRTASGRVDAPPRTGSGRVDAPPRMGSGRLDAPPRTRSGRLDAPPRTGSGRLDAPLRTASGRLDAPLRTASGRLEAPPDSHLRRIGIGAVAVVGGLAGIFSLLWQVGLLPGGHSRATDLVPAATAPARAAAPELRQPEATEPATAPAPTPTVAPPAAPAKPPPAPVEHTVVHLRSTPSGAAVVADRTVLCANTPCDLTWDGDRARQDREVAFSFTLGSATKIVHKRVIAGGQNTVAAAFDPPRPTRAPVRAKPRRPESDEASASDYKDNPY